MNSPFPLARDLTQTGLARPTRLGSGLMFGLAAVVLVGTACDDTDKGATAGTTVTCAPDTCDIGGVCLDNLAPNPANPCEACIVLVDRTRFSAWDAGTCDDDDACTVADRCDGGSCTGDALSCDDGDPCTEDLCDSPTGECTNTVVSDPDGACGVDPCLASPDCDDDNPCTEDRCEPFEGCVSVPLTGRDAEATVCDDGNACTLGERCIEGTCEPDPSDSPDSADSVVSCDDDDLCTIDVCDPEVGCRNTSIADLCNDDNPCTDEACEPDKGCVYPFNTDPCDDKSLCTASDTCTLGACLGTPVPLDDDNPCTDDLCDPLLGVLHVDNTLPCDDKNACTLGDFCANARCLPGRTPLECDDTNVCTDDACDPLSGCRNDNHTRPCNDVDACTAGDACSGGACLGATVVCNDDNACTADACLPASGCEHTLIVSNPCRPTITITHPPRGATLTEGGTTTNLVARGTVTSGAGPITSLRVNGVSRPVDAQGNWTATITPDHGGNILVVDAVDSFGSTRKKVQSYLWSRAYRHPTTAKNGIVPQGLGLWLDKLAIDDGTRGSPPNDLASILQIALRSFDLAALIPRPVVDNLSAVGERYDIYLNNFSYSPATVTLTSQTGGIRMVGRMNNGSANIRAQRDGCQTTVFGACVTPMPSLITGSASFSSLIITADLDFSVVSNDIRVTVRQSTVQINGLDVQIDGIFGWLGEFILGFFMNDLRNTIQSSFNDQIGPIMGPLVRDALRQLAFQVAFDVPKPSGNGNVPLSLVTDWSSVTCSAEGCAIQLRAGAYTTTKVTPYTNSGVPNRDACGSGTQSLVIPEARILELSLADDTTNQLLFALWRGGLLEFPVPAAWLTGVDLAQYGITNLTMVVSGMLAPTVSDCSGRGLEAHMGDVKVTASMRLFGQQVDVVIWASVFAGFEFFVSGRELGIRVTNVRRVETEVSVQNPNLITLEPVIADLIRDQVVGQLTSQLGGTQLGTFPLPDIDLAGAISGLPAGTGIRITPETLGRASGNTVVGGRLN